MSGVRLDQLDPFLHKAWDRSATDLLFTVGAPPLARIDGVMTPYLSAELVTESWLGQLLENLLPPELWLRLKEEKEIDLSFDWEDQARFLWNVFHQKATYALALRLIPFAIPTAVELGLPKSVEALARLPQGLVLFTGPTGSGKSTTQAALIDWINRNQAKHILTIEDPIEYIHQHRMSAVNQREIGEDTPSFACVLRSALREDPDILLVGEMRDLESIQSTLTIAETGHLVFATLHTNDASQTLDRIIDVFPVDRQAQVRVQLSGSLAAVVSQRLLPRVDGGQLAAFEVLIANHAVRNLIKDGKSRQLRNVMLTGQQEGMLTLEMSLSHLVAHGFVDYEVAVAHSMFPTEVAPAGQRATPIRIDQPMPFAASP